MMHLSRYQKAGVTIMFGLYLAIGLCIFRDYGVHTDEYSNRKLAEYWGPYIEKVLAEGKIIPVRNAFIEDLDERTETHILHTLTRGPVWELALYYFNKEFYADKNIRDVLLMRHLLNFLLFYVSVIYFFRLILHIFKNYSLALCGALMYILHPRVFADSFYNTVDLAFLSFYTMAIYTLMVLFEKKDTRGVIGHAVICALAVDIRTAGLVLPLLTVSFLALDVLIEKEVSAKLRLVRLISLYLLVFAGVMVLFNPLLWSNTVINFMESIRGGVFNRKTNTPPEYNLFWIAVTTPPAYLWLFIVGFFGTVGFYIKNRVSDVLKYRVFLSALFLFVAPISLSALLQTSLYDSWRHHYFIYSSFVMICVFGIERLWAWAKTLRNIQYRNAAVVVIAATILLAFLNTVSFMVRAHPFQYVYANVFAKRDPKVMNDYWMVTGWHALEYILAHDPRPRVYIGFPGRVGNANFYLLRKEQRERIREVRNFERADYLIVNDASSNDLIEENHDLFHSIKVDGIPIMVVYKKRS